MTEPVIRLVPDVKRSPEGYITESVIVAECGQCDWAKVFEPDANYNVVVSDVEGHIHSEHFEPPTEKILNVEELAAELNKMVEQGLGGCQLDIMEMRFYHPIQYGAHSVYEEAVETGTVTIQARQLNRWH